MPVTVALPEAEPAVAVKEVEVDAAGTMTEAGTDITPPLLESVTETPPTGAAALSVTIQVLEAPAATVVGLQPSEDSVTGAGALTVTAADFEVPFNDAVSVLV
jgi:hypothetical protein